MRQWRNRQTHPPQKRHPFAGSIPAWRTKPVQAIVKVREVPREEPEEVDAPGGTSEETVSTEDETIALSRAEACSVLKEFYKEHAGYTWSARCCAAIKVAIDVLDGTPGITEGDAE